MLIGNENKRIFGTIVIIVLCLGAVCAAKTPIDPNFIPKPGPIHVFPDKAWDPYPADGDEDVDVGVVLSWKPGGIWLVGQEPFSIEYDVYFGGEYKGRQGATSYDPGGLEPCDPYNWHIDQVEYYYGDEGEFILVKTGDDWSFTTVCITDAWVDDDYCEGCSNDGHTWGYDAFDKVQDGLYAVAAGGKVNVAPGTYYENIIWPDKQGIKLLSEQGPAVTVIDGREIGTVVTFGPGLYNATVIDGFMIRNGLADNGGGIGCYNSYQKLTDCIITHNTSTGGAGIYCGDSSSPDITHCTISNNDGDAVYCESFSSPYFSYNNIVDNTGYGVRNDDPNVVVDAKHNWWGDASGPGGVAEGAGDAVSANVAYDPWGYCGDLVHPYPTGDINKDGRVDLSDFAIMANKWLQDTGPCPIAGDSVECRLKLGKSGGIEGEESVPWEFEEDEKNPIDGIWYWRDQVIVIWLKDGSHLDAWCIPEDECKMEVDTSKEGKVWINCTRP